MARRVAAGGASSPGSLTVVGTGIKYLAHVTHETPALIEQADVVVYGVADPATVQWIRDLNPNAEQLCDYVPDAPRWVTYEKWVDRMLECVRGGLRTCAAFYGHPGVFVYSSHEAIRRARADGYEARMVPGLSAEDCLFADLGVDPYLVGCQSFEATDFLVRPRRFDTATTLILWQISTVGQLDYRGAAPAQQGLAVLAEVLASHYGAEHEVVVYQAARLPVFEPVIRTMPLSELAGATCEEPSTLYVPPKALPAVDAEMVERLGIPRDHLRAFDRLQGPSA